MLPFPRAPHAPSDGWRSRALPARPRQATVSTRSRAVSGRAFPTRPQWATVSPPFAAPAVGGRSHALPAPMADERSRQRAGRAGWLHRAPGSPATTSPGATPAPDHGDLPRRRCPPATAIPARRPAPPGHHRRRARAAPRRVPSPAPARVRHADARWAGHRGTGPSGIEG